MGGEITNLDGVGRIRAFHEKIGSERKGQPGTSYLSWRSALGASKKLTLWCQPAEGGHVRIAADAKDRGQGEILTHKPRRGSGSFARNDGRRQIRGAGGFFQGRHGKKPAGCRPATSTERQERATCAKAARSHARRKKVSEDRTGFARARICADSGWLRPIRLYSEPPRVVSSQSWHGTIFSYSGLNRVRQNSGHYQHAQQIPNQEVVSMKL